MKPTKAICLRVLSAMAVVVLSNSVNLRCNIFDIKVSGKARARATNEIRNRILTGHLLPGDRLDIHQLTAEFGLSRAPIRGVLLELSVEGLVAITPQRGMAVVGVSPEEVVDNFAVLATLAGKAAEMATARITECELHELHVLGEAMHESDDVLAAARRFHRALNLCARSPHLLDLLRQSNRVLPTNYFEIFPRQQQCSLREHAALLHALGRNDGPAARTIAEDHVLNAGELLGDWLAARALRARNGSDV
jgi:DNA-binding GntR family transcriptional regulator